MYDIEDTGNGKDGETNRQYPYCTVFWYLAPVMDVKYQKTQSQNDILSNLKFIISRFHIWIRVKLWFISVIRYCFAMTLHLTLQICGALCPERYFEGSDSFWYCHIFSLLCDHRIDPGRNLVPDSLLPSAVVGLAWIAGPDQFLEFHIFYRYNPLIWPLSIRYCYILFVIVSWFTYL